MINALQQSPHNCSRYRCISSGFLLPTSFYLQLRQFFLTLVFVFLTFSSHSPFFISALHVRSPEHSRGSAIEVLGSPDHGCGTVCLLNCDSKTFASPSLGGYLRHFCLSRLGALWLLCFNGAGYKHSYLLTYFLSSPIIYLLFFLSLPGLVSYFSFSLAPCARLNWQFSVSFQVHDKSSSSYRIVQIIVFNCQHKTVT